MRSVAKALAASVALIGVAGTANAATFDFEFTGNTVTGPFGIGSIVFTGTGSGTAMGSTNPFLVSSLTGTLGATGIPGATTSITGVSSVLGADDLISTSSPFVVDTHGVSFMTSTFGAFNIRLVGSSVEIFSSLLGGAQIGTITSGSITPAVTAVPGPIAGAGLLPILGAGVWFARRRKQLAA